MFVDDFLLWASLPFKKSRNFIFILTEKVTTMHHFPLAVMQVPVDCCCLSSNELRLDSCGRIDFSRIP